MIEIIKNYARTKISLVLRYVLENFEAEDEVTLSFEMVKKITDANYSLENELLSNSELLTILNEKQIKEAIEEVKHEFLNEILN